MWFFSGAERQKKTTYKSIFAPKVNYGDETYPWNGYLTPYNSALSSGR